MADFVCLRRFPNRTDAEMAQAALADAGIRAIVAADDAGGTDPALAYVAGIPLLVAPQDAERAADLLSE
jgi:hypothetical protein